MNQTWQYLVLMHGVQMEVSLVYDNDSAHVVGLSKRGARPVEISQYGQKPDSKGTISPLESWKDVRNKLALVGVHRDSPIVACGQFRSRAPDWLP